MFGIFDRRSDRTEGKREGFCSDSLNEVLTVALNYSKKNQAVLIILCGDIIDNYDRSLNDLVVQMYNSGIVDDMRIEKRKLLSILSNDETIECVAQELIGRSGESRKIHFVTSFHQMDYHKENAELLLRKLQWAVVKNEIVTPLVLNIPFVVYRSVKESFPDLFEYSICFRKRIQEQKEIKNLKDNQNVAKEDYNTYERAETERLKMIGEETAEKTVKARTWYTQNLELLKTEKDGMAMLLKHSNSKFEISTLPCSRRLYWKFSLLLEAGVQEFNLDLRIVYSEKFSERNPAVGIVIKNANKKLERAISRSRRCEKSIYNDIEFPVVFMIEGIYKENNRSAAAAAVEGLIALLGSLRLSDVL